MQEEFYDVIIVGAGPAGLACASEFIGSDKKVLVLEKNEVIGPKICAGGITGQNSVIDLSKYDRALGFRKQSVKIGRVKRKLVLDSPIYILDRADLGKFQLEKLKGAPNIFLRRSERCERIEKNHIETQRGVYRFNHLVGADGSNSIVRKHLKLPTYMSFGQYFEVPMRRSELIWNFDCKKYGVGYIWEFPQVDKVTVGVYYELEYLSHEKARKELFSYMKQEYPTVDFSTLKLYGAPINTVYSGYKFDHIYLVGDAAGFTSLTTGEGIGYGLESGSAVGREILEGVSKVSEIEQLLKYKGRQERGLESLKRKGKWANLFLHIFFALLKTKKFQKYIGS